MGCQRFLLMHRNLRQGFLARFCPTFSLQASNVHQSMVALFEPLINLDCLEFGSTGMFPMESETADLRKVW
jgi:hypothetical protein